MKNNTIGLLLLVVIAMNYGCSSPAIVSKATNQKLLGNQLKPFGRSAIDENRLELISSGVHFGVTFVGTECKVIASLSSWQKHSYIQYELDGVYQRRIKIQGPLSDTLTIPASAGKHTLVIYKATEAHTGPIFIDAIIAQEVQAVSVQKTPVIEFIGNSITCGAAADPSEVPCGSGAYHDQHNAYLAYGPRVARAVNANFILSSVSGIGIYRNWNSDHPVMPDVYEKTDFQEGSSRSWNFGAYRPDVVSIALGTNDFSSGDGVRPRLPFDSIAFTNRYVNFVKTVKSKYPKANIALLNSPMVSGSNHEMFVSCLNRVKRRIDALYPADRPVSIFLVEPMQPRGCSYHPSVEDHQILADQLAPLFRDLINVKY